MSRAIFQDDQQWLCLDHPEDVLVATKPSEVLPVISEVDRLTRLGATAVGFVSYEAAGAIDDALTHQEPDALPLACFIVGSELTAIQLPEEAAVEIALNSTLTEKAFNSAIDRIKSFLRDGDTYQVNFTHQMTGTVEAAALDTFAQLYRAQPSPYAMYIEHEDFSICSVSPELFFEREGQDIRCEPMKGTRPRGRFPAEDDQYRTCLVDSDKDKAENLMIVDMIRNDLGRIAVPGSVKVDALFKVMRLPTVWQQISEVSAKTDASLPEIFRALFPCASVTGAPRARTMALIKELEQTPRGVYTGALGVVKPNDWARFSVGIRTLTLKATLPKQFVANYGVGSGIVWDSDTAEEWQECQDKARVLKHQAPEFELLETMYWQPDAGVRHLELHLNRLGNSAKYFGYPLDEEQLRTALAGVEKSEPTRLRLLIASNGEFTIECHDLPTSNEQLVRLKLATAPVSSSELFLFHKTTHRDVYERAREEAGDDCDDVLLFNERQELTETSICNVILEIEGQWYTPPLSAGLLGGVCRQSLINEGRLEEKTLSVKDLNSADKIYICNSLRGIREAVMV